MATKASQFFYSIVTPTVDDFLKHKDIRHGMLAAMALAHMADYWACWKKGYFSPPDPDEIKLARKEANDDCEYFDLLHDLTDLTKHCILRSPSREVALPPPDRGALLGSMLLNTTPCNKAPSPPEIVRANGTAYPLEQVIRSVFAMWDEKLESSGEVAVRTVQ